VKAPPVVPVVYGTVPRLWPSSTMIILAGGPSLTTADVEACRGRRVIAIKDAIRLAPWASVLYACDRKWWLAHPDTTHSQALKFGLESVPGRPDVTVLRQTGPTGLEPDPTGLRTGKNSGFQAINLAVHLGASRIVLLGYDLQPDAKGKHHWFGAHPYTKTPPPYRDLLPLFPTLIEPVRALGVTILNASRVSALTCFERIALHDVLRSEVAA